MRTRTDPRLTRCTKCGRTWGGLSECHCSICHEHFSAVASFDAHRSGGQCRDPRTLQRADGNPTMMAVTRTHGRLWLKWVPEDQRTRRWWQDLPD